MRALRYRVSLRRLLVLVTLCCVFFTWLALRLQFAHTVAQLEDQGVFLAYDVKELDSFWHRVKRFAGISKVTVAIGANSDGALRLTGRLQELQVLIVRGDATNEGFAHLAKLINLERLKIAAPQVSGAALEYLVKSTRLKSLVPRGTTLAASQPDL